MHGGKNPGKEQLTELHVPHTRLPSNCRDHRLPDLEGWLESPIDLLPEKVP